MTPTRAERDWICEASSALIFSGEAESPLPWRDFLRSKTRARAENAARDGAPSARRRSILIPVIGPPIETSRGAEVVENGALHLDAALRETPGRLHDLADRMVPGAKHENVDAGKARQQQRIGDSEGGRRIHDHHVEPARRLFQGQLEGLAGEQLGR